MKKVKKLSISIGIWLSICILSLTLIAPANAAKSAIIYEYKTITQKKGEAFSTVLKMAGLTDTEKKWVDAIPIYHQAHSTRQFRFAYRIENKKRLLMEVRVTRGSRLANFVLSKKNDQLLFLQKPTQIPRNAIKKNITLQSTVTVQPKVKVKLASVSEPAKQVKKTSPIKLVSIIPDSLMAIRFKQAQGQPLESALRTAKLTKLQEKIIKDGDYLKTAKSLRQFHLYFQIDNKKRLLKGMKISRGKAQANFLVKKIGGEFKLVSFKKLTDNQRHQWRKAFANAKIKRLTSVKQTQNNAKKNNTQPIKLSSVAKHSGKYQVIGITQKKGQTLYSALKAAKLTSAQRNLVIAMPATKSAKTTRRIYLLLDNHHLRALRIVRSNRVAEYVLVKYKGKWTWTNEKGQIRTEGGNFARYPLRFMRVSSPFNLRRRHPITRRIRPHKGIDLKAAHGTPIYAPAGGVVRFSGRQRGYGIVLEIDHQNGYRTKYAHLSRIMRSARRGRYVKKGQLIAKVGNTGFSTGAHLHYEVIVNGRHRNPATVRLPSGRGGTKTLAGAKKAVRHYLPILRRLSR